jgi:hypothetical protein
MSNGEKTYERLRKGVVNAILENFEPDWEVLAKEAYEGFIADVCDDARVIWGDFAHDPETGEPLPDAELTLRPYLEDANCEEIGEEMLLSDLLVEFVGNYDSATTIHLLNNSLAAFGKKLTGAQ